MPENPSDKQLPLSDLFGEKESAPGLDIGYYFHLLKRYLWLFLAIVILAVAASVIFALQQPTNYAARAVLQVESQEQKVLSSDDLQTLKLEAADYLTTIVASLTSDSFLVRVAKASGVVSDPTFFAPRPDGQPYSDAEIASVMRGLVSASVRKLTRFIDVTVTTSNPEWSKLIAETVVKEFLLQTLEQRMGLARAANDFLRDESDRLKTKLQESEQKLQRYKEEQNSVSLEDTQNITVAKLKELNSQVTQAKGDRIKLESDMELLRSIPPDDVDRMLQVPSVGAIPQVQLLRSQIVTAETELAAVQKRYLAKHPKNIQAVSQIKQLKDSLKETLRNSGQILATQYQAATDTETKLNQALKEQEKAALELNRIAIPYGVLKNEVDSDRAMYEAVNNRLRETTVSLGIEKNPFRIVEEPMAATPVRTSMAKLVGIGLFLGLALAAGTIFGLDLLDSSLRYVDQAESFLGLPVLAVVSELEGQDGNTIPNVFSDGAQSQVMEAFRSMRTSLSLLGDEAHRRKFLVTSAVPGEGKTFCALNAAMAFALEGQKTVLVDTDLRLPALHRIFPDPEVARRHLGLTDYLAGNADIDKILMAGPQESLTVICAGNKTPNPGELLGADALVKLFQVLGERFDRVIIDSAPVNAVSDTLRITPLVDYVCLVIRAAKTPKKAIARGCKLIENAKGKLAGFILNRVHLGRDSAYYFYHYAYGEPETEGTRSSKKNSAADRGTSKKA
jgi:succinoglycan biosynthesis transport protein ExoP